MEFTGERYVHINSVLLVVKDRAVKENATDNTCPFFWCVNVRIVLLSYVLAAAILEPKRR